jgi:hypothetical protein
MATIVTAYFNIPKSKANHETYKGWMKNMLTIQNRMIIFCDASSVQLIRSLRLNNPYATIIVETKFEEFHCYKYVDIFKAQHAIDHERSIHSVELYLIWNEKSNFLKRATEIEKSFKEPHNTKFVWCDIGCFRVPNTRFIKWPDAAKIPDDRMLLLEVDPLNDVNEYANTGIIPNLTFTNHIGGTIFAGSSDAILKWHDAYFAMLERLYAMGRFVGKDQTVMSSVYITQPELCFCVKYPRGYYDRWFYLQDYLL